MHESGPQARTARRRLRPYTYVVSLLAALALIGLPSVASAANGFQEEVASARWLISFQCPDGSTAVDGRLIVETDNFIAAGTTPDPNPPLRLGFVGQCPDGTFSWGFVRAASTDFRTARLLGVKADRVIGVAVLLSGLLAAAVAVILTVQLPLVSPDFALKETIVVLVGVVVGGIDRLWTATLGGFAIGFATGVINGALPTDKTVFLPSVVFALVILVLLVRPAGLFARGRSALVERV